MLGSVLIYLSQLTHVLSPLSVPSIILHFYTMHQYSAHVHDAGVSAAPRWQQICSTPKITLNLLGNISKRAYCFVQLAACQQIMFVQVSSDIWGGQDFATGQNARLILSILNYFNSHYFFATFDEALAQFLLGPTSNNLNSYMGSSFLFPSCSKCPLWEGGPSPCPIILAVLILGGSHEAINSVFTPTLTNVSSPPRVEK